MFSLTLVKNSNHRIFFRTEVNRELAFDHALFLFELNSLNSVITELARFI